MSKSDEISLGRITRFKKWYRRSARFEADREVDLPVRPFRSSRGIFLHRNGMLSFLGLFVMVLFCINYSNNAGLICACLLALLWVVAILANHWVVSRIWLEQVMVSPGDENAPGAVEILWRLRAPIRPMFTCSIDGQSAIVAFDKDGWARVKWVPRTRPAGKYALPDIHGATSWPMSIAHSWFVLRPRVDLVVAPGSGNAHQAPGQEGQASASRQSTHGDPEGIKPRPPHDHASRWAWKPTLRAGRPMTYEWAQSGNDVVCLTWSSDLPAHEAWCRLRAELDAALAAGLSFQVFHPWGASTVMRGPQAAQSILCLVGSHAISRQAWGEQAPFVTTSWWRRLFSYLARKISREPAHA